MEPVKAVKQMLLGERPDYERKQSQLCLDWGKDIADTIHIYILERSPGYCAS